MRSRIAGDETLERPLSRLEEHVRQSSFEDAPERVAIGARVLDSDPPFAVGDPDSSRPRGLLQLLDPIGGRTIAPRDQLLQ